MEAGHNNTLALAGAGAATERINEQFGDSMDPDQVVREVDKFIRSGTDIRCRDCGWVKEGKCTMRGHTIDPGQSCSDFRHEYLILNDKLASGKVLL